MKINEKQLLQLYVILKDSCTYQYDKIMFGLSRSERVKLAQDLEKQQDINMVDIGNNFSFPPFSEGEKS